MSEPITKEFLIFTETAEFNDSVAYIVNSYMKYYLELMMQRKILVLTLATKSIR